MAAAGETAQNRAIAHRNRASAHRVLGNAAAALGDLGRAIELDPREAAALVERGSLLLDMGELAKAEADFTRASRLASTNVEALLGRAAVLDRIGQPQAAVGVLDKVIGLAPQHGRAHASRAHLLMRLKRLEPALADAHKAVELAPGDAWSLEVRGLVHRLRDAPLLAKADFDAVVVLMPNSAHGYLQRAGALVDLRQLGAALADYSQAIEREPRSAVALAGRAWCHYLAGDMVRAIADASAAITIDGRLAAAYDTRGAARLRRGDAKGALADFEAALVRDAGLRSAFVGRAKARIAAGDFALAYSDLQKALALPLAGLDDRQASEEAARVLEELRDKHLELPALAGPGQPTEPAAKPETDPGTPSWGLVRTASECRLGAQWDDRSIALIARAGLLGDVPGLQVGLAVETAHRPAAAGLQVAAGWYSRASGAAPIDLGDRAALQALSNQRTLVSIGPLQLEEIRAAIEKHDVVRIGFGAARLDYPVGDLWAWLPVLETCARALPREAPQPGSTAPRRRG